MVRTVSWAVWIWTSQAFTDTLEVVVETWEGLWEVSAERSLFD